MCDGFFFDSTVVLTMVVLDVMYVKKRQFQQNGSHPMEDFDTSSIHGQSMLKLERFCDTVPMKLWHFMVFFTLRFRYSIVLFEGKKLF